MSNYFPSLALVTQQNFSGAHLRFGSSFEKRKFNTPWPFALRTGICVPE
jgi:hypothetical protein